MNNKTIAVLLYFLLIQAGAVEQLPIQNTETKTLWYSQLWDQQIERAKAVAKEAGKRILQIRNSGQLISKDVVLQNGKKFRQTNADIEASQYIIDEFSKNYPAYGFLSQDQMDKDPHWYEKECVWIINPIDGTKEFERGGDDFHIQIGLLSRDETVLGVSYYPAIDTYVWAVKGQGAWLEKDGTKKRLIAKPSSEKILIKSSSYKIIESRLKKGEWSPSEIIGEHLSSTNRLLKMIEGKASLYVSLGASPEGIEKKGGVWNYGANVVIASEACLILKTLDGYPLNLRQPKGLLTEGVVLTNDLNAYAAVIGADWHLN